MVYTLRCRQHWDVKCPPRKKHMVAGKLVPTVRGIMPNIHRKKRIVLEVYGRRNSDQDDDTTTLTITKDHDDGHSVTATSTMGLHTPALNLPTKVEECLPGDRVVLRILKPRKHWGLSRDPESDSDSGEEEGEASETGSTLTRETIQEQEEHDWIEYRKFDLEDISQESIKILKTTTLEVQVGRGAHTEVRDFKFPNVRALQEFQTALEGLHRLAREIADQKIKEYQARLEEKKKQSSLSQQQKKVSPRAKAPTSGAVDETTALIAAMAMEEGVATPRALDIPATIDTDAASAAQEETLSESLIKEDQDINLLVEIVSATDLPIADIKSSDPYVVVWLGKTEVHRTKPISKNTDPVWTVDTGSLFILSATSRDFFQSNSGLSFIVKDYDAVGKNENLGKVHLDHEALLAAKGERVEYPLVDVYKANSNKFLRLHAPKLNIRVRPATKEDFRFIKTLHKVASKKKLGVYAEEAFVAPATHAVNRLKRETKSGPDGKKLYRVKPGPDPDRPPDETKWLTKEQIETECLKPSTRWIETGSGTLGKLYLEILHCDGLPNLDSGVPRDKTDAFCSIIYEDAIVNTDVINDELSPRWLPWSQRAFLLHMQHSSSQILIGVFDWDEIGRNDPVGRISVDITNFYENTDYVLTYTLYQSVLDAAREPRGTITIRLRMETKSFRDVLFTSLKGLPPANFVNVTKREDFRSARFVTCGEENPYKLDMTALKSYGNELQEYQGVLYYIFQAAMTVWLWRGHYPVNVCGCKFKLALHSMAAFVMGVLLVENMNLLPAFFLFGIGWFLLATNEERRRHPSPWYKAATFGEMWRALLFGRRAIPTSPLVVDDELRPLVDAYEKNKSEQQATILRRVEEMKKHKSLMDQYFAQAEQEAAEDEAEEHTLETKMGGVQLNPLKPILLPIQMILSKVCVVLRIARSVVVWDESVYAFIITNACFMGGILLLFVSWGWILRWVFRIVVWVFLGPWMKLVDIFIVRKLQAEGPNVVKRFEAAMKERSSVLAFRKRLIMIKKENTQKLRAMKRYMFGQYIARVPQFKEYRYPDIPLASTSKAMPHDETVYSSVKIAQRKHGQHLQGAMIPSWGDEGNNPIMSILEKSTKERSSSGKNHGRSGGGGNGVLSKANPMRLFRRKK